MNSGCFVCLHLRWLHGQLERAEAARLLMTHGRPGSFLVRKSVWSPGDYILTFRYVLGVDKVGLFTVSVCLFVQEWAVACRNDHKSNTMNGEQIVIFAVAQPL